jgi:hypothetical protein
VTYQGVKCKVLYHAFPGRTADGELVRRILIEVAKKDEKKITVYEGKEPRKKGQAPQFWVTTAELQKTSGDAPK